MPRPARKRRNPLFMIALGILTLVGGVAVGLRARRSNFSPPGEVAPGLWASKTGDGVLVLAARVGAHAILFDAGVDPRAQGIAALLRAMKLSRDDIAQVFLTHGHADHTAGLAMLPAAARTYAGAADVDLITGRARPEALLPKFFSLIWSNAPGRVTDPLSGIVTIPVGEGKSVRAFPVPGHTPGSYVYLFDGVLMSGDILTLERGQFSPGPAMFNPHPEQNLASIRALAVALTGVSLDRVCTSHGGCTAAGQGRAAFDAFTTTIGGR